MMRSMAVVISLFFFALPALAQPKHGEAGSALIFPLVDSREGHGTIVTVTNTNTSRRSCGRGVLEGDVRVRYTYFGFEERTVRCEEFNRFEDLTPGDTLTVIAERHNPEMVVGWLWVEAEDPETGDPIDFDFLTGSAIVVDKGTNLSFGYTPYSFRGLPENGSSGADETPCGNRITDVDGDSRADFNGVEYDFFPLYLHLDSFFQEGGNPDFASELTLFSLRFSSKTNLSFLIFNNNETVFSRGTQMDCFFRNSLRAISGVVTNLGGDPTELEFPGPRSAQTGWLRIRGDAPILGVFAQSINGSTFVQGRELQFSGKFGGPEDPGRSPAELPR